MGFFFSFFSAIHSRHDQATSVLTDKNRESVKTQE